MVILLHGFIQLCHFSTVDFSMPNSYCMVAHQMGTYVMASSEIWSKILQKISGNVPEAKVKVLLAPLHCEITQSPLQNGQGGSPQFFMTLSTPDNVFIASEVKKLAPDIIQGATEILGSVPELKFTVTEKVDGPSSLSLSSSLDSVARSIPSTAPTLLMSERQLALPLALPRVRVAHNAPKIQWKYSFEDFVVGPCNQIAHAAASNIISSNASVDMVLLCAGAGLGKTHLTQAVGQALNLEADRCQVKMEYLTAEEFTSQFVHAVKFNALEEFKERFRNLDMLLLEDIHCLRGKDKTQEELLYTIKNLLAHGGRVVLTSSFAPCDLTGVDSQLVSQFQSGFVATMERPDKNMRLQILQEKAKRQCMVLPSRVADLLADRVSGDVRVLESCLKNLILQSQFSGRAVSEEMAIDVIRNVARDNPELDLDDVVSLVCKSFSLTPKQLESKSRRQNIVMARNTVFFLLRKHTDMTLAQIGERFNRRHSTVIKGITSLESEMSRHTSLGNQIENTVRLIERTGARR